MKKISILVLILIGTSVYFLIGNNSKPELIQDNNNNGVWDDVEQKILAANTGDTNRINALFQISKVLQSSVTEAPLTQERAFELDKQLVRSMECLYQIGPHRTEDVLNLEGWVVNSEERTKRYIKFNVLLNSHFAEVDNNIFCDFEVEK